MFKRQLFFFYLILFAFILKAQEATIADTSLWIKTPLKFVTASVQLPYSSSLEKKDVYTSKGLQSLYQLRSEHKALELSFTASMRQVSAKEYKKALQEEINRLAVQFGGYPTTFKEKDKNNLSYEYVVIYTSDRKAIVSRIYFLDEYLVMLTAVSPEKDKYTQLLNYFLQSFVYKKSTNTVVSNKSKPKSSKTKSNQKKKELWIDFIDSSFLTKFPSTPNIKKYYINTNSNNAYVVTNYYFQNPEDNSAYLVSERNYNYNIEISSDSLFKLAAQTLIKEQKGKILSEQYFYAYQFPVKEYIFSSRKTYYRLRYVFAKNTLYQVLYAGNKKQVFDLQHDKFFDEFVVR